MVSMTTTSLPLGARMCSKFGGDMAFCACICPNGLLEGERKAYCSCQSRHSSTTCGKSGLTSVSGRKILQNSTTCADLPHDSAENIAVPKVHVYWRRKHYSPAVVFPIGDSENGSQNPDSSDAHVYTARSEKPSSSMEKHTNRGALHEVEAIKSSGASVSKHSGAFDGCYAEQPPGSDFKGKGEKDVVLRSVDDSCSSSMINTDADSASLKMETDENGDCSSSSAFVAELMGEDMSEKDRCIAILRSHGLLSCCLPRKSHTSEEDVDVCRGAGNSPSCGVCGLIGTPENMLICDQCDEAIHVMCCSPSMRQTSSFEWFCRHCLEKIHEISEAMNGPGSSFIQTELSSIQLMLEDSEPYITDVPIGEDFQAVVPRWSGPKIEDLEVSEEPKELDPPYNNILHGSSSGKIRRSKPISNWLQCQEVITGAGDSDGTICGKWRRAPIFEVQTEDWDCFSSVRWDPTYADCAVPQELGTEEVRKQLAYIEMLKPRIEAKKRKSDAVAANGSRTIVLALKAPARKTM